MTFLGSNDLQLVTKIGHFEELGIQGVLCFYFSLICSNVSDYGLNVSFSSLSPDDPNVLKYVAMGSTTPKRMVS